MKKKIIKLINPTISIITAILALIYLVKFLIIVVWQLYDLFVSLAFIGISYYFFIEYSHQKKRGKL